MFKFIKTYLNTGHRIRVVGILCFLIIYATAQTVVKSPPSANSKNTTKKRIELKYSSSLSHREGFDPMILIDSVKLYHDGAFMYCDSAYLNEATNTFEAFSNVRVVQGDTLFLYGNYLHYDANTKMLRIRENVRLENRDVTLFTDSMNYDRAANIAYYFDGGMLVDTENELTSFWGQYEPDIRIATFSDSVKLINPRFTLYSDTLKYETWSKVATILGPSTIVSDSATIYSSRGWYDTKTDESMLLDRSLIVNTEGNRTLTGDTIFYNRLAGFGEVFGNMFLQDTLQKVILRGHYGYYDELKDLALATDSAFCIDYSQPDSLYLHGDTLKMMTVDSIFRQVDAFHNVRFFRTDIQGVCDSLQFKTKNSTLYMYQEPVVWNENYQLSGDTIEVLMNDSTIEMVHVKKYCFAIEDIDSIHFNQLKGRDLKAFFTDKEIRFILVEGNAESIFYPIERDGAMTGMNRTESSYLSITLANRRIERLKLWPKASGKMTPLPDLTAEDAKFKDFQWFDYLRPTDKDDIFRKVKKKAGSQIPKRSSKFQEED